MVTLLCIFQIDYPEHGGQVDNCNLHNTHKYIIRHFPRKGTIKENNYRSILLIYSEELKYFAGSFSKFLWYGCKIQIVFKHACTYMYTGI